MIQKEEEEEEEDFEKGKGYRIKHTHAKSNLQDRQEEEKYITKNWLAFPETPLQTKRLF